MQLTTKESTMKESVMPDCVFGGAVVFVHVRQWQVEPADHCTCHTVAQCAGQLVHIATACRVLGMATAAGSTLHVPAAGSFFSGVICDCVNS